MNVEHPVLFAHVLYGGPQFEQARALRERVLRRPLGIPLRTEDVDDDENQHTLVALLGAQVIACLMLKRIDAATMKLRQMAVDPEFQRSGVGSALVRYAEDWARSEGIATIVMDARAAVTAFYENLGYAPEGEPFTQVGIPHWKMRKSLAA
jgi:predicted GNAT family N-acyltransferase